MNTFIDFFIYIVDYYMFNVLIFGLGV